MLLYFLQMSFQMLYFSISPGVIVLCWTVFVRGGATESILDFTVVPIINAKTRVGEEWQEESLVNSQNNLKPLQVAWGSHWYLLIAKTGNILKKIGHLVFNHSQVNNRGHNGATTRSSICLLLWDGCEPRNHSSLKGDETHLKWDQACYLCADWMPS